MSGVDFRPTPAPGLPVPVLRPRRRLRKSAAPSAGGSLTAPLPTCGSPRHRPAPVLRAASDLPSGCPTILGAGRRPQAGAVRDGGGSAPGDRGRSRSEGWAGGRVCGWGAHPTGGDDGPHLRPVRLRRQSCAPKQVESLGESNRQVVHGPPGPWASEFPALLDRRGNRIQMPAVAGSGNLPRPRRRLQIPSNSGLGASAGDGRPDPVDSSWCDSGV